VYTDIDGEPRPIGAGFDIGADELQALLQLSQGASADPVASGDLLTYTLRLTNTGAMDLHATVTDVLPAQVIPAGVLTWTAFLPAQGDPWTQKVTVLVDPGYAGPLTNTLQAASLEGAAGVAISRILAVQPIGGIVASNDSPTLLGGATQFTVTVETGSQVIFTWVFGDGSTGFGQVVTHTYPATGIYTATVSASNPVSSLAAQTIVIVEEAIAGLSASASRPTILGESTAFTATVATGSHISYLWDFGDGTVGAGGVVTHSYPGVGIYTATVTAGNPVSSINAQTTVIVEEAIAGLSVSASSPTIHGEATAFTATVAAGSHVAYLWDFGDGTTGSGTQTTHTYPAAGEYVATVVASNLVSQASEPLTVTINFPEHNLYLPLNMKTFWMTTHAPITRMNGF
jgi:uncharacterized repeat protein (TIGR01451 family)